MTTSSDPIVPVAAIDVSWMTGVLRQARLLGPDDDVAELTRETCGTGQLADSYRFTLGYRAPAAGPASVVGKFPSEDETSRAFGRQSGYYRNEIRFYEEIAPGLNSLRLPAVVHAALAENETDFVLLMEDLAPARVVDQLVGCSIDEAALVMEQAAALHAGSWERPQLAGVSWLGGTVASFTAITDGFPATVAAFPEAFGDLVPAEHLDEARKLLDLLEPWKAVLAVQRCLWHSDLRADNLLFDAQAGAVPIAVLDWQGVGYGCGTIDIAYYLSTSLTTEDRRAHERDLVRLYHDKLVALGVGGYSAEQCWEDYRVMAIHPLQTGIFGLGAVKRSERGDEMWRVWIERSAAHTQDLDSFRALEGRR
jgi:hypothetical protein